MKKKDIFEIINNYNNSILDNENACLYFTNNKEDSYYLFKPTSAEILYFDKGKKNINISNVETKKCNSLSNLISSFLTTIKKCKTTVFYRNVEKLFEELPEEIYFEQNKEIKDGINNYFEQGVLKALKINKERFFVSPNMSLSIFNHEIEELSYEQVLISDAFNDQLKKMKIEDFNDKIYETIRKPECKNLKNKKINNQVKNNKSLYNNIEIDPT